MKTARGADEHFKPGNLLRLQIMLAAVIPVAAVLLVGAYGAQRVETQHILPFTIFFLICAAATFVGERKIIDLIQQSIASPYKNLTIACKELLAGNSHTSITLAGEEVAELTNVINALLEKQMRLSRRSATATPPPSSREVAVSPPSTNEAASINKQLIQLLNELKPIANGDLRVRTSISQGYVGIIADSCNSLIEELAQFVKWTQYASGQVIDSSHGLLDRSAEMTKTVEVQMEHLSRTTEAVEGIVAFVQRLSNTSQLNVDIARALQDHLQREGSYDQGPQLSSSSLIQEAQKQVELLEGVLEEANAASAKAEALINDLYAVAQPLHQSNVDILRIAERINEIEALAARWSSAAEAFTVDDPAEDESLNQGWLL